MIYYEIRKVFCNFRACLLFLAIVFLNLFLGVYFQYRDYETIINGRTQLEATKEALLSGTETRDSLKKSRKICLQKYRILCMKIKQLIRRFIEN